MNNFDTTIIEERMKKLLREWGVSTHVYNDRPKSLPAQVDDFVVVRVRGSVEDMDCFGECTLGVSLFAKDAAELKNTKKLSRMYTILMENLSSAVDVDDEYGIYASYILSKTPTVMGDVPDDFGFHARVINIKTTIKVL